MNAIARPPARDPWHDPGGVISSLMPGPAGRGAWPGGARWPVPDGVLDLRVGLLDAGHHLVTRFSAWRRWLPMILPETFFARPLIASALCAIFWAVFMTG